MTPQGWRIDKHIPIAVIITIIIQSITVIWFTAQMDARVSTLEAKRMMDDADTRVLNNKVIQMDKKLVKILIILEMRQPQGGIR